MAPGQSAKRWIRVTRCIDLGMFFDPGSVSLLHEGATISGVLAAAGTVNGVRTIAFCTDGTVMGGAMGVGGCQHIVNAYDTAIDEQAPIVGLWHSGGAHVWPGVKALRRGFGVRGHDPGIGIRPADLRGRRLPAAGGAAYGPRTPTSSSWRPRAGCSSPDPT